MPSCSSTRPSSSSNRSTPLLCQTFGCNDSHPKGYVLVQHLLCIAKSHERTSRTLQVKNVIMRVKNFDTLQHVVVIDAETSQRTGSTLSICCLMAILPSTTQKGELFSLLASPPVLSCLPRAEGNKVVGLPLRRKADRSVNMK